MNEDMVQRIREERDAAEARYLSGIDPYGNRLVVKEVRFAQKTEGAIYIPSAAKQGKATRGGRVLHVGKRWDTEQNGWSAEIGEIKAGDYVLFGSFAGIEVSHLDGVFILGDNEILATVPKEIGEEMEMAWLVQAKIEQECNPKAVSSLI